MVFPSGVELVRFEFGFLFFLCVSSFRVYGVFLVGWVCDSRYGFLGAMRAVAQSISYEILLRTCIFCLLIIIGRFDLMVSREYWCVSGLWGVELVVL